MKKLQTKKLFYNQYLYCVTCFNPLISIFRNKNLGQAKITLDDIQNKYESGLPLWIKSALKQKSIETKDFLDAKILYNFFANNNDDYKLRCEVNNLCIYSNDKSWLKEIIKKVNSVELFYEPSPNSLNFLQANKNTIIVDDDFPYGYKCTFGYKKIPSNLADWCDRNKAKIKISKDTLKNIRTSGFVHGRYMYVKDDSILMLINIMAGNCITRTDKLVTQQNIDK